MEIEIAGDGWDVLVISNGLLERGGNLKMKIISEKLYYKIYFNLISQCVFGFNLTIFNNFRLGMISCSA
jgi:hypothetical protein